MDVYPFTHHAGVVVRFIHLRSEREGCLEESSRLLQTTLTQLQHTEVIIRLGVVIIHTQSHTKTLVCQVHIAYYL